MSDDLYAANCLHKVITVTNVSTVVSPKNPERKIFFISHDSAGKVYFSFNSTCTINSASFFINANETWQWSHPKIFYTGPISAIRASGSSPIVFTEFV